MDVQTDEPQADLLTSVNDRETGGQERHRRIRARSPAGPVARAAIDNVGLAARRAHSGLPIPAFSQRSPCPGARDATNATGPNRGPLRSSTISCPIRLLMSSRL